jgi:hypothetical protein
MMHGRGKSDFAIVAVKRANKAEHPAEQSAGAACRQAQTGCARMYGPAARYKMASKIDERESCNNVLGL